jgi:hypothetical protein
MRRTAAIFLLALLPMFLSSARAGGSQAEEPIAVGNATQLLLDDALIATLSPELVRSFHAPSFDRVVVQADHLPLAPWERGFTIEALGTSVVLFPGQQARLRMYYSLRWAALNSEGVPISHLAPSPEMYLTAIAESADGLTWTKPLLESCPFASKLNGANVSRSNVLGLAHEVIGTTGTVWVEPDADLSSRWRAVGDGKDSVAISYSADGIAWKRHAGVKIPDYRGMGGLDSQPLIFPDAGCDAGAGCHALITRIWCKKNVEWCKQIAGGSDDPRRMPARMVRRANILSLDGNGSVGEQGVVMRADAIDLSAHTGVLAMSDMGY